MSGFSSFFLSQTSQVLQVNEISLPHLQVSKPLTTLKLSEKYVLCLPNSIIWETPHFFNDFNLDIDENKKKKLTFS